LKVKSMGLFTGSDMVHGPIFDIDLNHTRSNPKLKQCLSAIIFG